MSLGLQERSTTAYTPFNFPDIMLLRGLFLYWGSDIQIMGQESELQLGIEQARRTRSSARGGAI